MKKSVLLTFLFVSVISLKSQVNCPLNTPEFPFTTDDSWNTYSWSANLYHPSQMGGAQTINAISFRLDNDWSWGNYTYNNVRVWVRNSNVNDYVSSPGYPGNVGFTQVYSGNITFNGSGVYTINFSTSFSYDGTSHYEVLFENRGGTDNSSEEPWFDRTNGTPAGVYPGKVGWGTSWSNAKTISSNRQFNLQIDNLGCAAIPLPVELLSTSLNCDYDIVELKWQTVAEVNNAYFTIKGSDDAENWTVLKKVKGSGNSTRTVNYLAKVKKGFKYYSLSQFDYDGTTEKLMTFVANCELDDDIDVYPNPATDYINFTSTKKVKTIQLINSLGQEVEGYKLQDNQIDVSGLTKGFYILRINGKSKQILIR